MATDLLRDVDFLKNELKDYYAVVSRGDDLTTASAQLQAALSRIEENIGDPAQLTEQALPQRWGYVQLVSLIGTVKEELKGLRVYYRE
jgi:hypothetical protein